MVAVFDFAQTFYGAIVNKLYLINMNSLLRLTITTVAITAVLSKQIDTGPRTETNDKTAVTKKSPQRYVAEEVVIYLTPSQLQAIQEGKGFIDSEPLATTEASLERQDGAESDQSQENANSQSQSVGSDTEISQEDEGKVASSLPAEEQNSEEIEDEPQFSWIYRPRNQKNVITLPDDLFTLLSNYQEPENQPAERAEPKAESGENTEGTKVESEGAQPDTAQRYRLVPYESATEASKPSSTEPTTNDPIRERWLRILEQNRIQLRTALLEQDQDTTTTTTTQHTTEQPKAKSESTLAKLRYSAKYRLNNQTNQYKEDQNKSNLEKQKELTKVVVRPNDVVRKEAKKANQQQKSLIKQVRVHTPVFIPIPESAKIPINSSIAFKGLKPISVQAKKAGTKDIVQKKPESQARGRGTEPKSLLPKKLSVGANNTLVEKRSSIVTEKEVPAGIILRQKGKPERITIIRHVINN